LINAFLHDIITRLATLTNILHLQFHLHVGIVS
jgi:hypothetical protein